MNEIRFAPLHQYTTQMMTFSTTYNVMDTKCYYCKEEEKTYLISSCVFTDDNGVHCKSLCKYDLSNGECIRLTTLQNDPSNFIKSYKISIDDINDKLYLLFNTAFCVFDLNTNKWNYITRCNFTGDMQSFITVYRQKEKVVNTEIKEEDKKAHYDHFVDAMQNKFNVEFDDNYPIEYDPKLKQLFSIFNTQFTCICGNRDIGVYIDGFYVFLRPSPWRTESKAKLPFDRGTYDIEVKYRKLSIWYNRDTIFWRIIDDYELPVDGKWRFVLVRDKVIIATHPADGLVYLIDVVLKECYKSSKYIYGIWNKMNAMILYDKTNDNVLFIEYGGNSHLRIPLKKILPSHFYAEELVNGYIMEQQRWLLRNLLMPSEIIKIIVMYFACVKSVEYIYDK